MYIVPWLVLIPFLLVRENRSRQAWMVLVPVGLLAAVLLLLQILLSLLAVPEVIGGFNQFLMSLILGLAVLWLISHKLKSTSRFISFVGAVAVMAMVGFAVVFCTGVLAFSPTAMMSAIGYGVFYGVAAVTILAGLAAAGLFCRKRYSPGRFVSRLLVSLVVLSVGIFMPFALIGIIVATAVAGGGPAAALSALAGISVAGVITGLALFAILMPFMILTFASDLYRTRFYSVFRLQGMLPEPAMALPPLTQKEEETAQ